MSVIDMFLKIDGIEGESQDAKHPGELDLLTHDKRVDNPTGLAAKLGDDPSELLGVSTWPDANFTMIVDKAYPKLLQACVNGDRIQKAVLTMRKAGTDPQEFLKVTYTDVLISKCEIALDPDQNQVPIVTFAFNFAQIQEEYKTQQADGSLSGPIKYAYSIPRGPQQRG